MTAHNEVERGKALALSGVHSPKSSPLEEISDGGAEVLESGPDWDNTIDGARFVLDSPQGVPAIWGRGQQVLWARGEALMIAGGQGLGKTTLGIQVVKPLVGLGDSQVVLGLPVADLGCPVLYMAMDRPKQIARAMRRQFTEAHRDVLQERLIVWEGPPPRDLAANPALLARMADHYGAGVVVIDSLKDAAIRLSEDAVGAQWNRSRQHLLAQGVQLLELHHTKKRNPQDHPSVASVDAVYGSTWLTSGCGSIIMLSGDPGDPILSFRHVKQPAEEVGPHQLLHDQIHGVLSIEFSVDLVELVRSAGADGLTAKDAAAAITEKASPTKADIEKARRRLDLKVTEGVLTRVDGVRGGEKGSTPAAWFLANGGAL
jgi:replicative DNA helicase